VYLQARWSPSFFFLLFFSFIFLCQPSIPPREPRCRLPSCLQSVSQATYKSRFESFQISLIPSPIYFVIFAVSSTTRSNRLHQVTSCRHWDVL
jgi:hypothetical protein